MEPQNKPNPSNLFQQTLPHWTLSLSSKHKAIFNMLSGLLLLTLGLFLIYHSSSIQEYRYQYDNRSSCTSNSTCLISMHVKSDLKDPCYIYYEIHNFYQNHRSYSKSLSVEQLLGHDLGESKIKTQCSPILKTKDLHKNDMNFSKNMIANPCGLIANSFFTDSFELIHENGEKIEVHQKEIVFDWEKKDKFKNSSDVDKKRWVNVKDERFIVWNSIAPTANFRKIWGKVNGIDKGKYKIGIKSSFKVKEYSGKKFVVVSGVSVLGGKNLLSGILTAAVGFIGFFGSFVFWYEFCCERSLANKT